MRRRRVVAVLLAAAVLVTACSDDDDEPDKPGRPIEARPAPVDYSGAKLAGVPGSTTTSMVPRTGTASIVGSVSGPSGLVAGATVRVEHLLGRGEVLSQDVVSGADGRYVVQGIPGGRYRVRAFVPPALAVAEPEVRFIPAGQEAVFDITMADRRRVVATGSVSPAVPFVGDAVNLAIVVAIQAVDADGIVRSTPIPGFAVELDGLGSWSLRRERSVRTPLQPRISTTTTTVLPATTTAFTDGSGIVRYELQCDVGGPPGLGILVAVTTTPPAVEGAPPPVPEQRIEHIELDLPECVDPTATTLAPSTTTTRPDLSAEDD